MVLTLIPICVAISRLVSPRASSLATCFSRGLSTRVGSSLLLRASSLRMTAQIAMTICSEFSIMASRSSSERRDNAILMTDRTDDLLLSTIACFSPNYLCGSTPGRNGQEDCWVFPGLLSYANYGGKKKVRNE